MVFDGCCWKWTYKISFNTINPSLLYLIKSKQPSGLNSPRQVNLGSFRLEPHNPGELTWQELAKFDLSWLNAARTNLAKFDKL